MSTINYADKIPNNVHLSDDRKLQRALESWQPHYIDWWREMGPEGSLDYDVYLRTAISAAPDGWAQFGHVKMPDYRWGIFLAPPEQDRRIAFGAHRGEPVWNEVPGEYRAPLRRLIAIQGDTEPASVEQQRHLGATCPSLYDLRNLFQVNVEEGRHLWAMVYLLHAYFGRDGREEAEELLARRSGDEDKPRILGAFNEKTPNWLSFFMFTFFTDRDGKFQLASLAESSFDPLARTCRFMLTEEAHHLFVGESGISRIVERTCQVMREHKTEDVRQYGVIDLPTIQKYLNFHFSVTSDLYGSEVSTNAANFYHAGLKGRFEETKIADDHQLDETAYGVVHHVDGAFKTVDVPALNALNDRLRQDWIADVARGVERWNRVIQKHGIDFRLTLPHVAFHRAIGHFNHLSVTPDGRILPRDDWERQAHRWLPTDDDQAYVNSLMAAPVTEPGKFANWIAPPARGINNQPIDFEYVRFA
ncbi:benzoyl-CoA 2,3-epoxidase subunit BoxB [Azospirillum sp. ST 5-10]|uniref:benzoyl-CoA 2,3-epoxidase subunit BoxB n=1 Tax=unclassified Azospirillum TaxID=2630922 RepID=UPI003F49C796